MIGARLVASAFALAALLALTPALLAQGIITTVAGTPRVFRGDGGPALNATLGAVNAVGVDAAGNVYASDNQSVVVKITPSGTLSVVAGNSVDGFSGEGGPATRASVNGVSGFAFDAEDNIYIADSLNHRIRKISRSGVITTVAGDGIARFAGDNGPAVNASLNFPFDVALDAAGNLYIADFSNSRVRKVDRAGMITTVAGDGVPRSAGDNGPATAASVGFPAGLAFDRTGNLYIAESFACRVRRVRPDGIIETFAGTGVQGFSGDEGPAINARFTFVGGVKADGTGNVFVVDSLANRIRRIDGSGIITTIAGGGPPGVLGDGGPATSAFFRPAGLAVDALGNLYIADFLNFRIRKVTPGGILSTIAGDGRFGFSGDGGIATRASLLVPQGVAVDRSGNLIISDTGNQRVRKVTADGTITTIAGNGVLAISLAAGVATQLPLTYPAGVATDAAGNVYVVDINTASIRKVTPAGQMSTVAGNGRPGFSGDDGPATDASLGEPLYVAADSTGNVYIPDRINSRIRRVDTNGIIRTIAGTGTPGFSGDDGPALSAQIGFPFGIAADSFGNVYFSDVGNGRIRHISPDGIIRTIAGPATGPFSGDGGPATAANFTAFDLALDHAGNLFLADVGNQRIRKITPSRIITTVAGNGESAFAGDGGPATTASLRLPQGIAVDIGGNIYIADTSNDRIRKVHAAAPSLAVTPASLEFSGAAGDSAVPAQSINIGTSLNGLVWTAQVTTESGGSWLAVSPELGAAPRSATVSIEAARLQPGTYTGRVTISAPGATPPLSSVNVRLTVVAGQPPRLAIEPASVTFEAAASGANRGVQSVQITNTGGGTLFWTASARTSDGANWLAVSPAAGSAGRGVSSRVEVRANIAGRAAGVYSGTVVVESSGPDQRQTISVSLLVTRPVQTILLSQTGLLFTGVQGGSQVPSQAVAVLNIGAGVMEWTAETRTLSGGNWLSISTRAGRSDAASLDFPFIEISTNASGLAPGEYSGLVGVTSAGASNLQQLISVTLNVLRAGSNPGVLVRPTGLIFVAPAGSSPPSSQNVRLATAVPGSVETRAFPLAFDRGSWLNNVTASAVVSPADPRTLTVQPTVGSLTSGVYRGAVTLLFSDGSPAQTIDVLFLVTPSASANASVPSTADGRPRASRACSPERLFTMLRTLPNNFSMSVGWPVAVEAEVVDSCGNPVTGATVVASFSSGDAAVPLASLRNGLYAGTWRPNISAPQVTVRVRADLAPLSAAEASVRGVVGANPAAPAVFQGGVVNAASFAAGDAVAPGSIVSIFGRNLARGQNVSSQLPLLTNLGGATLTVAGRELPLFFSSNGQVNAQLPFELAANARLQLVARVRTEAGTEALAVPEIVTVAASRPAIFTTNQQGTGQGAILNVRGQLVDAANPAAATDVVQIYATGLGMTNPAVLSGTPGPSAEPLARTVLPVEAFVGGRPAPVHYAGLAPGFVGLYQINVEIPAGTPAGSAVELHLRQGGVTSNVVTLGIR